MNRFMKKAKPQGTTFTILGQYALVGCDECRKERGNWFTGLFGYIDCRCTVNDTGSKHRTLAKLNQYPIT